MNKYACLVMDHDDTVVDSTATVHYPCFIEFCRTYFPHYDCTLEEYFIKNFDPGVFAFFSEEVGMSKEDMKFEERYWNAYVKEHIPHAYPGIREILEEQRRQGGKICVISHSYRENILRDYEANGLPKPDMIFGWECPPEKRKPNPWPLQEILKACELSPEQVCVVDDLKPGYEMARAMKVPFAAAGWANEIGEIEGFMRKNCDVYLKRVEELKEWLFV